ncbi:MAG: coenzyme F420-0:L-glutamate ligase [Novosphingobium sp.]
MQAGDIIVVTSKILSKAENRFAQLEDVVVSAQAAELAATTRKDERLVELVLTQSSDVVRAVPHVFITRHQFGLVMANAGIDQSNLGPGGPGRVLLLPEDPDASAATLRDEIWGLVGIAPAVVISDSFGRPWRNGVVAVAIGASGLPALLDRRGELDRQGRMLEVTQVALADMIASAAGLVMGEGAEGIPVALVRGFCAAGETCPAASLVRPVEQDLFR